MLVAGKAADRRRMQAQSGRAADFAVDHRGQHLTLESAQWRGLAQVEVTVDSARRTAHP